jgi:uncharacterized protein (DUF1499 family)
MRRTAGVALLAACLGCAGPVPDHLGLRDGALAPCPSSPNCVSSEARDTTHGTDPFVLAMPASEAWPLVREVVAALPGAAVVTATDDYLHAECTTPLLRFVDDLEIALQLEPGRLAVRSASRKGYSDLGANRERVWELRRGLAARGVIR